jgi:hypothetical protein
MVTHEEMLVHEMPATPLSMPPSFRPGKDPLVQVVPDRVSVTLVPDDVPTARHDVDEAHHRDRR